MNITIARARVAIAAIACLLALTANSASSAAETLFISQVRSAFTARDSAKLMALVCWDRVEPGMRQGIEQQFSNLMKLVPIRIECLAIASISRPIPGNHSAHY